MESEPGEYIICRLSAALRRRPHTVIKAIANFLPGIPR